MAASNELVVDQDRTTLTMDYCAYGHRIMTTELRRMEYEINHKNVSRPMKENRLLCRKVIRTQGKRQWVKYSLDKATTDPA